MSAPRLHWHSLRKSRRLRWHKRDDLIFSALYRDAQDTARSILRQLYLAAAPRRGVTEHIPSPEQMREFAADNARRLLDLNNLVGGNGVDAFLVHSTTSAPHLAAHLEEARTLIAEIGGAA